MNKGEIVVHQTDYGMPVYNLQQMLRAIFQVRGMQPELIPDGFFNETTENAVKNFQRMKNMEPTGVVDNETWDLIVEEYDFAVIEGNDPICVQLFTREDFKVPSGEARARLAVLQAMLQVMHKRFRNLPHVEITGVNDAQTNDALKLYREVFALPQGEGMDHQLWYHFVKAYESSVLPHDFENPEKNGFKPEEARQQIDLSRRDESSMADMLPDEQMRTPVQMPPAQDAPQAPLNRMPMLDSYQSLRTARDAEEAQTVQPEAAPAPEEILSRPNIQKNNGRQTRPPLKWNL